MYWLATVVLLATFFPVGLFLLLRKLLGGGKRSQSAVPGTQGITRQGRPVDLSRGRGMTVAGIAFAAVFGIALVSTLPILSMGAGFLTASAILSPAIGFFLAGLAMTWVGTQRNKQAKRFRKYLAPHRQRESVSITTLAQAMPVSFRKACHDLQDMLDSGILETGYLDMSTARLILSDEGVQEPPQPEERAAEPQEEAPLDMSDDNAVLGEIRRLNEDIDDEVMSRKIDRIGEISGKIFAFQKQHPNRAGQLRSF